MPSRLLSDERVRDSSEDESASSADEIVSKPTTNGTTKPDLPQADNDSDNEIDKSDGLSGAESDSSSSSNSSTDSKSSSTSSVNPKRKANDISSKVPEPPAKRSKTSSSEKVRRIEASTYAPPQGYAEVPPTPSAPLARTSTIFNQLDGKQIWHITAPATLPISKIQSLDLQSASQNISILEHKGTNYSLNTANLDGTTVLIPNTTTAEYAPLNTSVTKAFDIQELATKSRSTQSTTTATTAANNENDPSNNNSPIFFATQTGYKNPPRQQPQNLKARNIPYGVPIDKLHPINHVRDTTTTTNGDADTTMTEAKPIHDLSEDSEVEKTKPKAAGVPSTSTSSKKTKTKTKNKNKNKNTKESDSTTTALVNDAQTLKTKSKESSKKSASGTNTSSPVTERSKKKKKDKGREAAA